MTNDDLLKEAKDRYEEAQQGWSHIYDAAADDMRFVYDIDDGQWPKGVKEDRIADDRPIITVNKLQKFIRQIRGDQMMNRPRVKVIPVDSVADPQKAELINGIIRQIEYLSDAGTAYDTAYGHAIASSVGFFRLITKYSDGNSFNQDLFIKRIINPLSVHFDPSSVEFSMEDAKYAFVEELVDKKAFERMYKGAEVSDFDGSKALFGGWLQNDKVRVAEYFYKDPVRTKIVEISDGTVIPLVDGMTIEKIKAMGEIPVRDRMVDSHVVKWVKMSGAEVLEESEWPGRDIPIIPVFGDEIVIDGKRHYLSLARGAKDPQQMYNFWATAATETVALAPKNPFIVDHRQIKGFEKEWEEANHKNRMYIRYNAVAGLNKPAKEQQTQIPTAIMNMMQTCAYDIEDHLGRYESSKGETSNERSGKAIIARINQADKGTYTFVDNLARAIIACGKQLVDLIPKIYDTQRAIRIMGETGEHEVVDVNKPVADENGLGVENDLTVGKFDVISTVGASYTSKREEMVEMMIQSMQYAGPEISAMIVPLIFKYSDWPGSEEISQTLQKKIEQAQQGQQMQQGQK